MSIAKDPNFRAQYETALKPDPEVEAALSGSPAEPVQFRPAPQPVSAPSLFGPMVRLR